MVATFTNVLQVTSDDSDKLIEIYTGEDELITFDTTVYKTTVYQN